MNKCDKIKRVGAYVYLYLAYIVLLCLGLMAVVGTPLPKQTNGFGTVCILFIFVAYFLFNHIQLIKIVKREHLFIFEGALVVSVITMWGILHGHFL